MKKMSKKVVIFLATVSMLLVGGLGVDAKADDSKESNKERIEVIAEKGDTVWDIGEKHKINMYDLLAFNEKKEADLLHVGEKIVIPNKEDKIPEYVFENVVVVEQPAEVEVVVETPTETVVVEEVVVQPEIAQAPASTPQGGQTLTMEATAYDAVSLGGLTASGYRVTSTGERVIAVDPSVIPMGSRVHVSGYGDAIAVDTGGAIQGHIIDLNMSTADAIQWGRRTVTVTIY